MERIHRAVFDDDIEFTAWQDAIDIYSDKEWNENLLRRFAVRAKEIVEASESSISESYYLLKDGAESIQAELDRSPYSPDDAGTDRDGFEYSVEGRKIIGRYIYSDISTEITYSGNISRVISENSVRFEINKTNGLFIVNTISVIKNQKIKKAINNLTNTKLKRINLVGDNNKNYDSFISEISGNNSGNSISLIQIGEVKMTNLQESDDVQQMELNMESESLSHPEIKNRINDNWRISNMSLRVGYAGNLFELRTGSNSKMCYMSVDNVTEFERGEQLVRKTRPLFLDAFSEEL
jgi:hypothetical protein